MYNTSNITATLPGIFSYVNTITNNAFGWVAIAAIFAVSLFSLSSLYPSKEAFASSSFITLIMAVLFWIAGLVPESLLLIMGLLSAVSLAFLIVGR